MKVKGIFIICICVAAFGCNGLKSIKGAFNKVSPYEEYLQNLDQAQLLKTPMAKAWIAAGERALNDSIVVELPFVETGFFDAGEPQARSYRFEVREGQVLTVEGDVKTKSDARIFQDLFVWKDGQWDHLEHSDSTFSLRYEFKNNDQCLLRIQPELLVNAYYSITIAVTPVLINPVSGANNKSIGSFYGDIRDGGRRKHEGVDIFAPKGTPVIAPTDGYVIRSGNTGIGGKVVWMSDRERGHSYYFAHLDSQLVRAGTYVKQGDTLGTVGNTGNARTTPPHLHFGIYQRGSRDPINYIRTMENIVERIPADTAFRSLVYKVSAKKINFRSGPGEKHSIIMKLDEGAYVEVTGKSDNWYRVSLPDKRQGFVYKSLVSPADTGNEERLTEPAYLLSEMKADGIPVTYINDSSNVEVLAHFRNFKYVKTSGGLMGWIISQH